MPATIDQFFGRKGSTTGCGNSSAPVRQRLEGDIVQVENAASTFEQFLTTLESHCPSRCHPKYPLTALPRPDEGAGSSAPTSVICHGGLFDVFALMHPNSNPLRLPARLLSVASLLRLCRDLVPLSERTAPSPPRTKRGRASSVGSPPPRSALSPENAPLAVPEWFASTPARAPRRAANGQPLAPRNGLRSASAGSPPSIFKAQPGGPKALGGAVVVVESGDDYTDCMSESPSPAPIKGPPAKRGKAGPQALTLTAASGGALSPPKEAAALPLRNSNSKSAGMATVEWGADTTAKAHTKGRGIATHAADGGAGGEGVEPSPPHPTWPLHAAARVQGATHAAAAASCHLTWLLARDIKDGLLLRSVDSDAARGTWMRLCDFLAREQEAVRMLETVLRSCMLTATKRTPTSSADGIAARLQTVKTEALMVKAEDLEEGLGVGPVAVGLSVEATTALTAPRGAMKADPQGEEGAPLWGGGEGVGGDVSFSPASGRKGGGRWGCGVATTPSPEALSPPWDDEMADDLMRLTSRFLLTLLQERSVACKAASLGEVASSIPRGKGGRGVAPPPGVVTGYLVYLHEVMKQSTKLMG